jgi:phage head maturation protease
MDAVLARAVRTSEEKQKHLETAGETPGEVFVRSRAFTRYEGHGKSGAVDLPIHNRAITLPIKTGDLTGVSVGFDPGVDEVRVDADGEITRRVRVKRLPEVSLVDQPAYQEASVLAVRAERARLRAWAEFQAWRRDMEGWR